MTKGKLAALFNHEFQILEFPVPKPMDGSLVIKVEAASICGSDAHIIKMDVPKPGCEGHEFAGKIIDMAPNANDMIHSYGGDLKIGDRIAVYPWVTCGKCDSCQTHGEGVCGVCDNGFIYGGPHQHGSGIKNCDPYQYPHFKGGFGEYVHIFPKTFVWKIPDDMPSSIASLLDPTAVAMRAIELAMTEAGVLQEGISTSTTGLVIGAGPIGIIAAMILKTMGAERVLISDMLQEKLTTAQDISKAHEIINIKDLSVEDRITYVRDLTHGGADIIINCANHPASQIEGLQMVRKLGTYVEVGNAMAFGNAPEVPLNLAKVVFSRNARVTSVVANYPKTFDRAFRLLKRYKEISFERLITHKFYKLEDLSETMSHMRDQDYLKGVLLFS